MTDDTTRQLVLGQLGWGRDNAKSHSAIAETLGSVSRRQVEIAVSELRRDGKAIAGGSDGQWMTGDPDEIDATADWLDSKIATQAATVRAMRATAKRLRPTRQTSLWDAA